MLNVCAFVFGIIIFGLGLRVSYTPQSLLHPTQNTTDLNSVDASTADTSHSAAVDASSTFKAADAIVFVEAQNSSRDLYLMNPDGSGIHPLTHDGSSSSPAWSPGHRQIAYVSRQNDVADIYVINADGSNMRQVTKDNGTDNDFPSWSPNSQWIAFVSNVSGKSDIWVVSAGGGKAHQLTHDATAEISDPGLVNGWPTDCLRH